MKATVACVGVSVLALAFPGCMPDFDSLTVGKSPPATCTGANGSCSGSGGDAAAGDGATNNGGSSADGGSNIAGTESIAGSSGDSGNTGDSGAAGESPSGGSGGSGGTGGAVGGTGAGGKAGNGGSAGAAGACVTTFSGTLKYSFDNAGNAGNGGIVLYPEDPTGAGLGVCSGPVSKSSTAFNPTEGHTCPGALQLTATFGAYASLNQITVAINFPSSDWTAYSLLHAWVKVKTPDATVAGTETLSYLSQLQFSVASSSKGAGTNTYDGYTASTKPMNTFADRDWHEITLGLVASNSYYRNAVLNIGIQLQSVGVKPASAPDAPPTTVVEIDDVWVE